MVRCKYVPDYNIGLPDAFVENKDGKVTFYEPGVKVDYYQGDSAWLQLPDFNELQPYKSDVLEKIDIKDEPNHVLTSDREEDVAAVFSGLIKVSDSGLYTLGTESDDGSKLFIDGNLVVDNDGLHGAREATREINLDAG